MTVPRAPAGPVRTAAQPLRLLFAAGCAGLAFTSALPARAAPSTAATSATSVTATSTSTSFAVGGAVAHPAVYDATALAALPALTQTDTYTGAGAAQTHTYTGPALWAVLDAAGIVTRPGIKNDLLGDVLVATGADGYRAVFSLGELAPAFGQRASLIATAETGADGSTRPLAGDGFARLTAPGDLKGGRYVSNLTRLDVVGAPMTAPAAAPGPSARFTVDGAVVAARSYDLAALQTLPSVTRSVAGVAYTGVSFWDLLNAAGIATDPSVKNDLLGKVVVATGSDGYRAVFSLGELAPDFGHADDLIAYAADGQGLGGNGFARLVVPGDVKAGRWVSNLASLQVVTISPVPEPGTAALALVGVGLVATFAAVRRRFGRNGGAAMPAHAAGAAAGIGVGGAPGAVVGPAAGAAIGADRAAAIGAAGASGPATA